MQAVDLYLKVYTTVCLILLLITIDCLCCDVYVKVYITLYRCYVVFVHIVRL